MAFSWGFNLLDGISKPAITMASGLEKVEDALHHAEQAIAKSGLEKLKDPLEKNAAGLRIMRNELAHNKEVHERFGKSVHETVEHLKNWLEVFYFGGEILKGFAEKASEFGREIIENMRFKQGALVALEALTGTRQAAIGIFEEVEQFSAKTGIAVHSVMDETRELMTAGYKMPLIEKLRPMLADLRAVGPREYGGMTEILRTIGLGAPISSRVLKSAGLDIGEFNRQLAATHGDTLKALVNTFTTKYDTKGRGLGAIALDLSRTLPGALDRVKQIPEIFMSTLSGFDSGAGGGVFARALTNIADAFSPGSPSAEHMIGTARNLINSIADAFGFGGAGGGFFDELAGPHGIEMVSRVFDRVALALQNAIPTIQKAADAILLIGKALAWAGPHIENLMQFGSGPHLTASERSAGPMSPEAAAKQAKKDLDDQGGIWLWGYNDALEKRKQELMGGGGSPVDVPTSFVRGGAGPTVNHSPTVNVHIQGNASREDGEHIAQRVKESLTPFASNVMDLLAQQGGYGDAQ